MTKVYLIFVCLAVCQLAYSDSPVESETLSEDSSQDLSLLGADDKDWIEVNNLEEDEDDDESRSFWDKAFHPAFHALKKVLRVEPLKCQSTVCSSCMAAFNKGGCFTINYNRQTGPRATLSVELKSMSGRRIFGGSINAGKPIPNCVNLHTPIKHVCIQQFTASVGDSGIPTGDICFTINFREYHLGVRFCSLFTYGSFTPVVLPSIVKT